MTTRRSLSSSSIDDVWQVTRVAYAWRRRSGSTDGRDYPAGLPRHSVSVGGAVVDPDGRLLAIERRDNGEWELPGGIVELDEDPREAVRREVVEETGVVVELEMLTGVYKNMRLGVVSLVFRCRPLAGEAHPTDEASRVAWLTPEQVGLHMAEAFAIRLLDALDDGGPYVRIHDGTQVLPPRDCH